MKSSIVIVSCLFLIIAVSGCTDIVQDDTAIGNQLSDTNTAQRELSMESLLSALDFPINGYSPREVQRINSTDHRMPEGCKLSVSWSWGESTREPLEGFADAGIFECFSVESAKEFTAKMSEISLVEGTSDVLNITSVENHPVHGIFVNKSTQSQKFSEFISVSLTHYLWRERNFVFSISSENEEHDIMILKALVDSYK